MNFTTTHNHTQSLKERSTSRNIEDLFPRHLLLKILSLLDVGSVESFLEVFNQFKKDSVIITDEGQPLQFFGRLTGVARVEAVLDENWELSFRQVGGDSAKLGNGGSSSQTGSWPYSIQLIEISKPNTLTHWAELLDPMWKTERLCERGWRPAPAGPRTFLFLNESNDASTMAYFNLKRTLMDQSSCKWYDGLPRYLQTTVPYDSCSILQLDGYFSSLESLRIEQVVTFADHTFPVLKYLMVDFSTVKSEFEAKRTSISSLDLPEIITFVIHYRKYPPLIFDIEAGYGMARPWTGFVTFLGRRIEPCCLLAEFELTDVRVMESVGTTAPPISPSEWELGRDYEKRLMASDFHFTFIFDKIVLNGVPNMLAEQCLKSDMYERLKVTVCHPSHWPKLDRGSEYREPRYGITCGPLHSLHLTIDLDNWVIPKLTDSGHLLHIWDIQIFTMSVGVDFSELLRSEAMLGHFWPDSSSFYLCLIHSSGKAWRNDDSLALSNKSFLSAETFELLRSYPLDCLIRVTEIIRGYDHSIRRRVLFDRAGPDHHPPLMTLDD